MDDSNIGKGEEIAPEETETTVVQTIERLMRVLTERRIVSTPNKEVGRLLSIAITHLETAKLFVKEVDNL